MAANNMNVLAIAIAVILSASAVESHRCSRREFVENCECLSTEAHTLKLTCNVTTTNQLYDMLKSQYVTHVTSLELRFQGIQLLPARAFTYEILNELSISSDGFLRYVDGDAFRDLRTSLHSLQLTGTKLEKFPLAAIIGFEKLQILLLNNNKITSLDPQLRNVPLQTLTLRGNRITEIGSHTLPVTLNWLDLGENNIISLEDILKEDLSKLKILDITSNVINHIGHETKNVPNLRILFADGNSIRNIENGALGNLKNLVTLRLSHNLIRSIHKGLNGLENLEYLILSFNDLVYLHSTAFNDLHYLKELDLSNNRLRFIQEDTFDCLTSLTMLLIPYNRFGKLNFLRNPTYAILFGQGRVACTFRDHLKLRRLHMEESGVVCKKDNKEVVEYLRAKNVIIFGDPCYR